MGKNRQLCNSLKVGDRAVHSPKQSLLTNARMESEIFGAKIARLNTESLKKEQLVRELNNSHKNRYILASCEGKEAKKIRLLENQGFRVAGFPISLSANLARCALVRDDKPATSEMLIRPYQPNDLKPIKNIAKGAFKTHWHNTKIPVHKIDEYYMTWAKNSCNGRSAIVLIAEYGVKGGVKGRRKVVGFNAVNLYNPGTETAYAQIDLIAVDPSMRGKGVGSNLVKESLKWAISKGIKEMRVKTEALNYQAMNLYLSQGFRVSWFGVNMILEK